MHQNQHPRPNLGPATNEHANQPHPALTYHELMDMRERGEFPELIPGTEITGMPNSGACNTINAFVRNVVVKDLSPGSVSTMPDPMPVALSKAMDRAKDKVSPHQPLTNIRAIFLAPDATHLSRLQERQEPGTPAFTVAYVADGRFGGRRVPSAVVIARTYAVGREKRQGPDNGKLAAIAETETLTRNGRVQEILEDSRAVGHVATAEAMVRAQPSGHAGSGMHGRGHA